MITQEEIKNELKDIRFYYSKKTMFEAAFKETKGNSGFFLLAAAGAGVVQLHAGHGEQAEHCGHCRNRRRQTPAGSIHLRAEQHGKRRNAGADGKKCMQHVERAGIAACQITHDLVVVVGDCTLADADKRHRNQQPDRIAADQQHTHADGDAGCQQNE